jgi:tight adherence protein C
MALLLAALAFLTMSLLIYLLAPAPESEQQRLARRLAQLDAGGRPAYSERDAELEAPLPLRLARPVTVELSRLVGRFTPKGRRDELRRKLTAAGNPGGMQVQDYLAFKGLLTIALPVGTLAALARSELPTAALLAAVAFALGSVLPEFFLKSAIDRRKRAIQKALPDVLDLLTVSVEAGLAFDSAIAKVVEKLKGPLADEFQRMLQDVRMGMPRREALKEVAARSDVSDLNTFIASLVQADTLGVSISKVLRIQSEQMRNRRKQRAEETAMKAPIKMIFPLLIFIFPTIFIVLLGPAVLQILDTFLKTGPK